MVKMDLLDRREALSDFVRCGDIVRRWELSARQGFCLSPEAQAVRRPSRAHPRDGRGAASRPTPHLGADIGSIGRRGSTGNLGGLDGRGYLRVAGRLKDMIIRGGENIYATEIEQVLFTHAGVRDVTVLGLPDPTWGEIVAAVIVPTDADQVPSVAELHDLCRAKLAPHKTPADGMTLRAQRCAPPNCPARFVTTGPNASAVVMAAT